MTILLEKDIEEQIKNAPETIFDREFTLQIDQDTGGRALRDDLAKAYNMYGRLNRLTAQASILYEEAKNQRDEIESLAWSIVNRESAKFSVTAKKKLVSTTVVEYDGKDTTLAIENAKVLKYQFYRDRGKAKVKEMSDLLDLGRSLLSWDRTEFDKLGI